MRGISLAKLVASVDEARGGTTPLASSLRVLALRDALHRASGEDATWEANAGRAAEPA